MSDDDIPRSGHYGSGICTPEKRRECEGDACRHVLELAERIRVLEAAIPPPFRMTQLLRDRETLARMIEYSEQLSDGCAPCLEFVLAEIEELRADIERRERG